MLKYGLIMKFNLGSNKSQKAFYAELETGLRRLDFANNFNSFEVEVTVPDQTETVGDYKIRNQFDPHIPTGMLIIKQTGNAFVTAGDTEWTKDYIYIKNHSTTIDAVVKLVFFKD